ncbi:MAG TPA: hypothetical protein VFV43_00380 [Limnobacter sp.]|nr:hypothetical protein [Limnobacter sp.]
MNSGNCKAQLGHWLAGSDDDAVYYCSESKVVSLCMHYMTLRFDASAFRELLGMMGFAQAQIEQLENRATSATRSHVNCAEPGGTLH